jgi:hypothetical protein
MCTVHRLSKDNYGMKLIVNGLTCPVDLVLSE